MLIPKTFIRKDIVSPELQAKIDKYDIHFKTLVIVDGIKYVHHIDSGLPLFSTNGNYPTKPLMEIESILEYVREHATYPERIDKERIIQYYSQFGDNNFIVFMVPCELLEPDDVHKSYLMNQ